MIGELALLDDLDSIAAQYALNHGEMPENVSHWNPGASYSNAILPFLSLAPDTDVVDYIFTEQLAQTPQVLASYGLTGSQHGGIIVANSTASLALVLHWVAATGRRPVLAPTPIYFSVPHACSNLNIPFDHYSMQRTSSGFRIPPTLFDRLNHGNPSVVWLTNPVYGTGCSFADADLDMLESLLKHGHLLVADEAYAHPSCALSSRFGTHPQVIYIYSPHKSVNINALKFSVISCSTTISDQLEQLVDIVTGGLGVSSRTAISHFLSHAFSDLVQYYCGYLSSSISRLRELCLPTRGVLDNEVAGHFLTIYFPHLPSKCGYDKEFMTTAVTAAGAIFVPAQRCLLTPDVGLAFRVNLTRACPSFWGSLGRLLEVLSESKC